MTSPQKIQPAASSGCSIPNVGAGEPGPPVGKAFPGESSSWHRIPRKLVLTRCCRVPATGARALPGHQAPQQRPHSDRASSRTFLWQQSREWQRLDKARPAAARIPCCWHCCRAGPGLPGRRDPESSPGQRVAVPCAHSPDCPSRWCPGAWGAARGAKAPQRAEGTLPGPRGSSPSQMPALSSGRQTLG